MPFPRDLKIISLYSLSLAAATMSSRLIHAAYFQQCLFNHSIKCIPMRSHVQNGQTSFPFSPDFYLPSVRIRIRFVVFITHFVSHFLLLFLGARTAWHTCPKIELRNCLIFIFILIYFKTFLSLCDDLRVWVAASLSLGQHFLFTIYSTRHTRIRTHTVNSIWPKPSKQNAFFCFIVNQLFNLLLTQFLSHRPSPKLSCGSSLSLGLELGLGQRLRQRLSSANVAPEQIWADDSLE